MLKLKVQYFDNLMQRADSLEKTVTLGKIKGRRRRGRQRMRRLDGIINTTDTSLRELQECDPRDGSPPGSPVPGILQARTLEWVAIFFSKA